MLRQRVEHPHNLIIACADCEVTGPLVVDVSHSNQGTGGDQVGRDVYEPALGRNMQRRLSRLKDVNAWTSGLIHLALTLNEVNRAFAPFARSC